MTKAETPAHRNLKRLALIWAQQQGYRACATEVRLPRSRFRADVAAYKATRQPGHKKARLKDLPAVGMTAIFECKQSRADFLKDSYSANGTYEKLKKLDERRQTLERLLKVHYPSLLGGESLFSEFDSIKLTGVEHRTYQRVCREIGILQRRLFGKLKFEKLVRYRCANLNYLVVEDKILAPHEVPVGWGLLVRRDEELILERKPLWQEIAERERLFLLHRIALAGTRRINAEFGIDFEEVFTENPLR